ncbi:MAG: NADH-quinone oxidoreductase subunit I [Candidatus Obscuribacter sp.]|nr:NADH-quinone oxidoreductase subunit I [Candidatus Obscuribacter sp.]
MANLLSRAFDGLNQVRRGLATVFGHTFKEPITKEYPQDVPHIAPLFRGRLALTVNPETGDHLCISCRQCERVCPDKCIEITSQKSAETGKLELIDFKIDHGLCMFCGLCTEVCPTLCIINTNDFELSEYSREALVYDLKKLTLSQDESAFYFDVKDMPLPKPKPAKAAPAAGAAAPAAAAAKPAVMLLPSLPLLLPNQPKPKLPMLNQPKLKLAMLSQLKLKLKKPSQLKLSLLKLKLKKLKLPKRKKINRRAKAPI